MDISPSFSASLPDGWDYRESLTLGSIDGVANIIATTEGLSRDFSARDFADWNLSRIEVEFDESLVVRWFGPATVFGSLPGYAVIFDWLPEDTDWVTHTQLFWAENRRAFTATATVKTADYPRMRATLDEGLRNLRITTEPQNFPSSTRDISVDHRARGWPDGALLAVELSGSMRYGIVKVLASDSVGIHIRKYSNSYDLIPQYVDERELSLKSVESGDPHRELGIGHLPLSFESLAGWRPVLVQYSSVSDDELIGYRSWLDGGGGYF